MKRLNGSMSFDQCDSNSRAYEILQEYDEKIAKLKEEIESIEQRKQFIRYAFFTANAINNLGGQNE